MGVVKVSAYVVEQRERADGIIVAAAVVKNHGVSSDSHVVNPASVEQQRCSANRDIVIRVVQRQRSTTYSGIEAGSTGKE